jgi:hypothetical protein
MMMRLQSAHTNDQHVHYGMFRTHYDISLMFATNLPLWTLATWQWVKTEPVRGIEQTPVMVRQSSEVKQFGSGTSHHNQSFRKVANPLNPQCRSVGNTCFLRSMEGPMTMTLE